LYQNLTKLQTYSSQKPRPNKKYANILLRRRPVERLRFT